MNKQFVEIIGEAVRLGFHSHNFASNGALMTPDVLRSLPRNADYLALVDYCADESFFETHRGTPGSWRKVRDNLAHAINDPTLSHIHFHIGDISAYSIHDRAEQARRFSALKAMFDAPTIDFYQVVYHNYLGLVQLSDNSIPASEPYHLCPYPWTTVNIASNGDVVACCRDSEHRTVLGNLFESSFKAIWNGERYQSLRRDLRDGHPERQYACKGCSMPRDASRFSVKNLIQTARLRL